MPLILLTGLPSSGKSRRAQQISDYCKQRCLDEKLSMEVMLIRDETLHSGKTVYDSVSEEKMARGAMLSAIERDLRRDSIVVADGMHYIKGFRYQIYCVARGIGTPMCAVYCGVSVEMAREWNKHRTDGYPADTFDQLAMRFEEPDSSRRWEHPLFTVLADDVDPPYDAIWNAVVHGKAAPPNMATVVRPVKEADYLFLLDSTTKEITDAVMQAQRDGLVHFKPPGIEATLILPDKSVTLSQLTRLRRQFLNMNKLRGQLQDMDTATVAFVDYLNTSMQAL